MTADKFLKGIVFRADPLQDIHFTAESCAPFAIFCTNFPRKFMASSCAPFAKFLQHFSNNQTTNQSRVRVDIRLQIHHEAFVRLKLGWICFKKSKRKVCEKGSVTRRSNNRKDEARPLLWATQTLHTCRAFLQR